MNTGLVLMGLCATCGGVDWCRHFTKYALGKEMANFDALIEIRHLDKSHLIDNLRYRNLTTGSRAMQADATRRFTSTRRQHDPN
jgi:hypothetical protein